jgi:hypothetical protein
MKLGSENKKAVWALVLLGGGALYGVYGAFFGGPSSSSSPSHSTTTAVSKTADTAAPLAAAEDAAAAQASASHRAPAAGRTDEFKPKIWARNAEDRQDVTKIDPTLRLDLLAALQKVPAPSGTHNLFQVGVAPVKAKVSDDPEPRLKPNLWAMYPPPLPPPPGPPTPTPPPKPVPINVKYYGWAAPTGTVKKRAFFLDGDDIIIRAEGESLKGHYRVVRIEAGRVVIEDLNDKLQQTLTKVEDAL